MSGERLSAGLDPGQVGTSDAGCGDLVERLARRTAEILAAEYAVTLTRLPSSTVEHVGLVDAATLAGELGVSRAFVYQHADELGAVRLGSGERPRLRFDVERARSAARGVGERSDRPDTSTDAASQPATRRRSRRMPNGLPKPGAILTARPRDHEQDAA